ncbi:TRAP transporter small permease [Chelativorans sp. SCAU2101]|jgi:TRAP-type C4-dicarboxylate transport system, small permease component|uniref:TRAP transporter small permease protein n=1 Tax=Chelativorans petroleitrophicus TaxID=2975484 RepID=A0A9X2X5R1_9HYPH|nr:TRAP transporter small permease [Chelativorans petroleitrophicus]MCT8988696.1 TRAP transporter small permease [Chelativorans petroleitrophicus]
MRALNAALDWLVRFSAILACVAIAGMSLLIVLEVILRSMFSSTLYFIEEYSGYMVLVIMALGLPYCRERNALLTVDFFISRLEKANRRKVEFVYGLVSIAFCILLDWYVIELLMKSIQRDLMAPTVTRTPLWIPQIFLPFGITLLCLVMIRKLFRPDPMKDADLSEDVLAHEME